LELSYVGLGRHLYENPDFMKKIECVLQVFFITNMYIIYVLKCMSDKKQNKFYVGRCESHRFETRMKEHEMGRGSSFTQLFSPVCVTESYQTQDVFEEDRKVIALMQKYGTENVRGGTYSSIQLPQHLIQSVQQQLNHASHKCLACGGVGHFAHACSKQKNCVHTTKTLPKSNPSCFRCGRSGHWARDCYARTHKNGPPIKAYAKNASANRRFGKKNKRFAYESSDDDSDFE